MPSLCSAVISDKATARSPLPSKAQRNHTPHKYILAGSLGNTNLPLMRYANLSASSTNRMTPLKRSGASKNALNNLPLQGKSKALSPTSRPKSLIMAGPLGPPSTFLDGCPRRRSLRLALCRALLSCDGRWGRIQIFGYHCAGVLVETRRVLGVLKVPEHTLLVPRKELFALTALVRTLVNLLNFHRKR